jgi:hypothetical protein
MQLTSAVSVCFTLSTFFAEDDCTLNFAKSDYYKGSQLLELPTKPERGKGKVPQSKYKWVARLNMRDD